jgi:hypothetical protein
MKLRYKCTVYSNDAPQRQKAAVSTQKSDLMTFNKHRWRGGSWNIGWLGVIPPFALAMNCMFALQVADLERLSLTKTKPAAEYYNVVEHCARLTQVHSMNVTDYKLAISTQTPVQRPAVI